MKALLTVAIVAVAGGAGYHAHPQQPKGPFAHVLLGSEIVLATLGVLGGLYLLLSAFGYGLRRVQDDAIGFYAGFGALGITLGVLFGAKIAFGL